MGMCSTNDTYAFREGRLENWRSPVAVVSETARSSLPRRVARGMRSSGSAG